MASRDRRRTCAAIVVGLAAMAMGHVGARSPSAQSSRVVINEVQYDPEPSGDDSDYEWLELRNGGPGSVTMSGWRIADGQSNDPLPEVDLGPGEYLIVAGGPGFAELFPDYRGRLLTIDGPIGNGLGNTGDRLLLIDGSGNTVDALSYGDDNGVLDPSAPDVAAGHSLERYPAGADSDSASDWIDQSLPTPGEPAEASLPPTDAATEAPTAIPTSAGEPGVTINEYLPAPRDVDWDGDGVPSASDEWVELYNAGDSTCALAGWQLDDQADGGSTPYRLGDDAVIGPGGYLVLFRRDSHVVLNNDRDTIRLLRPNGVTADETSYSRTTPDASLSRQPDGVGSWTDSLPPSPGGPNGGNAVTPGTPTPTPGPSATPGEGGPTPTATNNGVASPTPAATATAALSPTPPSSSDEPVFLPFLVTEVLFDPAVVGNDFASEWIELYNRSDRPATTAGWSIGDSSGWDALGAVEVPPGHYVVVATSADVAGELAAGGAVVVMIADGRIGNGLANKGDLVRVRGPTGVVADAVGYGYNLDAFDPAVPLVPPGWSVERIPSGHDTDSADDWWSQPLPSPGRQGERHEAPPAVRLNEVLPSPRNVDWSGDGVADYTDEWIEIQNLAPYDIDLERWRLSVGEPERWDFSMPGGWRIASGGFRVIHRRESSLALGNAMDTLRLIRPDGVVADEVTWGDDPGYDTSLCRLPDGSGAWASACQPTPAEPNRALDGARRAPAAADADRKTPDETGASAKVDYSPVTLADARAMGRGAPVIVGGRLTVPAGPLGDGVLYIGDEGAGIRLYVKEPDAGLAAYAIGERIGARGRLDDYHGERQLAVDSVHDVWSEGPGAPVAAVSVATGEVGEPFEGRLVVVQGGVVRAAGGSFWLDDGSGECRVMVDRRSGFRRPWVEMGSVMAAAGIVSQYAQRAPWEDGYRLIPRAEAEIAPSIAQLVAAGEVALPERLPRTGRSSRPFVPSSGARGHGGAGAQRAQ